MLVSLQEFFDDGIQRVPEVDGMLYIKCQGKKAWRKLYFVLRASGIYYNPKGKSKVHYRNKYLLFFNWLYSELECSDWLEFENLKCVESQGAGVSSTSGVC